jgi:hypothetical protein
MPRSKRPAAVVAEWDQEKAEALASLRAAEYGFFLIADRPGEKFSFHYTMPVAARRGFLEKLALWVEAELADEND